MWYSFFRWPRWPLLRNERAERIRNHLLAAQIHLGNHGVLQMLGKARGQRREERRALPRV